MRKPVRIGFSLLAVLAVGAGVYVWTTSEAAVPAGDEATMSRGLEKGHGGQRHSEQHSVAENMVEISDRELEAAGIELGTVADATLRGSIALNGILQPNQEALVQVTPRFPGLVREIKKRIGETVEKGELLARIESNQSLTTYEMRAPISGMVIERQISLGEYASEQKPAFVVADIATVWVDLTIYKRDLPRVRAGDTVVIDVGDGGKPVESQVSYVSPVGNSDTQSAIARAVVANDGLRLRSGLFVSARLMLPPKTVPIAVRPSAIQSVQGRTVVFVRSGDRFEARDVSIGMQDSASVEIVSGLSAGDSYAATNSFTVKAEMAKGAAVHDH